MKINRRALIVSVLLTLVSWVTIQGGIALGHFPNQPIGPGNDLRSGVHTDLFRFDSEFYYDIARNGYSYNGDPNSSPNIVFAPAYPLAIKFANFLGLDSVTAGFALNKVFLTVALYFLFLTLHPQIGLWPSIVCLFAMVTTAGAYSYHAYYSEALMLLLLAVALYCSSQNLWPQLACASAVLGATRITALPIVLFFSTYFLYKAWVERKTSRAIFKYVFLSALCSSGLMLFLGYIWIQFGNPLRLFPEIQSASWGFFHPPTDWFGLLTGASLAGYWSRSLALGWDAPLDIKTLNLVWTTLALAASVYCAALYRRTLLAWIFIFYFMFVYLTNSNSEYLISAHRFFALMVPIFLMFTSLHKWVARNFHPWAARLLTGLLLLLNLAYGLFHTAYFNNGVWYYF